MPKVPHRIFEIFDSVDEAIREVTSRTEKIAPDDSDPDSWTFQHLVVKREVGVTLVHFTAPNLTGDMMPAIQQDFTLLAERLNKDNRILVDFTDVESANPYLISSLSQFTKKIRNKGSRVVLANLNPSVREVFFAASPV